jgi:hypothetical protein
MAASVVVWRLDPGGANHFFILGHRDRSVGHKHRGSPDSLRSISSIGFLIGPARRVTVWVCAPIDNSSPCRHVTGDTFGLT